MKYRIIIQNYTNPINGERYVIAVNTKQGTILDSTIEVKNKLHVRAVVNGYLNMYRDIEIHPGALDTWIEINLAGMNFHIVEG